jgi:hypothetical protein
MRREGDSGTMANREKGEVSLTVGGKAYTFLLDTNALAELEDLFTSSGSAYDTLANERDSLRELLQRIVASPPAKLGDRLHEARVLLSSRVPTFTFAQAIERADAGSMRYVRGVIWAALQEHHPEMTVKDVGKFISEAGGVVAFADKFKSLMDTTVADQADVQALEAGTNPPKARAKKADGTGAGTTATPVALA